MHVGKRFTLKKCATFKSICCLEVLVGLRSDHFSLIIFLFSEFNRKNAETFAVKRIDSVFALRLCWFDNNKMKILFVCSVRVRPIVYVIRWANASYARACALFHCLSNKNKWLPDQSINEFLHFPLCFIPVMPFRLDWSTFCPEDAWKSVSRSRTIRASFCRYSHVWACWRNSQTLFQKVFHCFTIQWRVAAVKIN